MEKESFQYQFWLSQQETLCLCGTERFWVWNWEVFGVEMRGFCVELRGVLNWEVFGVELRGFRCWTEEFWVVKRCGPCVEMRGCGTEGYSCLSQNKYNIKHFYLLWYRSCKSRSQHLKAQTKDFRSSDQQPRRDQNFSKKPIISSFRFILFKKLFLLSVCKPTEIRLSSYWINEICSVEANGVA